MTRTELARRRYRLNRKIRQAVARRRFAVTVYTAEAAHSGEFRTEAEDAHSR